MSGINLLPEQKLGVANPALRRWLTLGATISLTIYIVIACAVLGWWTVLNVQKSGVNEQTASLTQTIRAQSAKEALILEIDSRSAKSQEFLESRTSALAHLENLTDSEVLLENVAFSNTAAVTIDVLAGSSQAIENFALRLREKYASVTIVNLRYSALDGWSASMELI